MENNNIFLSKFLVADEEIYNNLIEDANNNDKYAQFVLARLHTDGYGFSQDYDLKRYIILPDIDTAIKYYRLSADQGYMHAQIEVINLLAQRHRINEAIKYCNMSSIQIDKLDKNHATIKFKLGRSYYNFGIHDKAYKYLKMSLDDGFMQSHSFIGTMYRYGHYVKQDHLKALQHYVKYKKSNCEPSAYFFTLHDMLYDYNTVLELIIKLKSKNKRLNNKLIKKDMLIEHLMIYPGDNGENAEKDFDLFQMINS